MPFVLQGSLECTVLACCQEAGRVQDGERKCNDMQRKQPFRYCLYSTISKLTCHLLKFNEVTHQHAVRFYCNSHGGN